MKIIHRVIKNEEQEKYIELMKVFDYELLERIIEEKTTDLHFIKYGHKPYSKKLARLEKEYFSYQNIKLFPFIFVAAVAFLLITAFLVLALLLKGNFDYTFWFLVLLLPALGLIVLSVGIFIYKYFRIVKDPIKNRKRQEEILLEAQKLKE